LRLLGLLAALGLRGQGRGDGLRGRFRQRLAERRAGLESGEGAGHSTAPLPPEARTDRDIAYGQHPAQRLDLYRPAATGNLPVVVFVHGGGWRRGDKAMPQMVGNKVPHWLKQGCIVVSTNYRMLPEAGPLQQAEDVALALAFVQRQAAQWGGDAARIVLVGHSAGAHLAALLAADAGMAASQGAEPWCATVAIDSAALDMVAVMSRPHYRFYDPVFGNDPEFWRAASPAHRLTQALVSPMLLVCSSQRADSVEAAQAFVDKATALGSRVELLALDLNHMELNDRLGEPGDYTRAMDAFLRSVGVG
jgi:arylformamidase